MNLALSIRPSVCPSATVFSQEWLIFFYPKEDPFICGFLFKSFQNTYGQLFLMLLMFLTFQLFLHVEKRMYEHAKVYRNYKKKIYQNCLYINFTIFNANYELCTGQLPTIFDFQLWKFSQHTALDLKTTRFILPFSLTNCY